ncbi:transporter substrate-binding domain-containing protein [Paraburkholderia sp. J8-2]|uniref:transporter substrate-binding domain-containing protein n=1 Tax=Paraburkholderia sp. J8-2 TaxID=2805440 RepID=UPI002AB77D94|nr:transporter substrate-binding domain-containing protein [Paraburkholderia sp. J8-2]
MISYFEIPRKFRAPRVAMAGLLAASLLIAGSSSYAGETGVPALAVDQEAVKLLPESIKAQKVLRVVMPTNEPPTQYYEAGTQNMTGINPEIARLIGQALGLRVDIKVATFDAIIPGMAAGRYDMSVASMTPTTERMKVLDFVDYMAIGEDIVVPKGNPLGLNQHNLCGKKVALLTGSYQLTVELPDFNKACQAAGKAQIQVSTFQETQQAIAALISGRQDAVWADSPILDLVARQNAEIAVADTFNFDPVAVGVSKDSNLLKATSAAVAYVIKSPAYLAVLSKYGVKTSAVTNARVNFAQ